MRKICDWSEDKFLQKNLKLINDHKIEVTPWQLLSLDDDPQTEFIRAKKYGSQFGFSDFKTIYINSNISFCATILCNAFNGRADCCYLC